MDDLTPSPAPPDSRSAATRFLDRIGFGVAIVATIFMVFRRPTPDFQDMLPVGPAISAFFLILGGALWIAFRQLEARGPGRSSRRVPRLLLYGAAAVLAGMLGTRVAIQVHQRWNDDLWPPGFSQARSVVVNELPDVERATWALWLAIHAASDSAHALDIPTIPADWPYPDDVRLAIRLRDGVASELVAVTGGGEAVCHAMLAAEPRGPGDAVRLEPICDERPDAASVPDAKAPVRSQIVNEIAAPTGRTESWAQHRNDAARSAASDAPSLTSPRGWRVQVPTPMRASLSVVDDVVLAGGHLTGLIAALDRETGVPRWFARAPNWIHQEPVTDGRIVLVGFGDKDMSLVGKAPSGIAAFELATGRRLWTAFDESSVMTSPVIQDGIVAYVSAAGMLRKRDVSTGSLIMERLLPGGVIMGPPTLSGGTLVVNLEPGTVCAVDITTFDQRWCSTFPGLRRMGHGSPAVAGETVVVSAVTSVFPPGPAEFLKLPLKVQAVMLRAVIFPKYWSASYSGQLFMGLDLATGRQRWISRFFSVQRDAGGHMAGTPAIVDGRASIVLALADSIIGFDPNSGAIAWSHPAHGARGAPLIFEERVLVAGRDGVIEVRRIDDGILTCRIERKVGWDRAGPVRTGGLIIFADLEGGIEAIPTADLRDCARLGP